MPVYPGALRNADQPDLGSPASTSKLQADNQFPVSGQPAFASQASGDEVTWGSA
jgi:hypothetical protein